MIPLRKALTSSVGKKYIMSLTGLSLVIFTILHLAGNLLLFKKDAKVFNEYAEKLESFGLLFNLAEIGLLAVVVLHMVTAINLKMKASASRLHGYAEVKSKGGPTRANIASKNMIITGLILFAFLVLHLWQFRFEGAAASKDMEENLYAMVYSTFKNPLYVFIYEACMIVLGAHLRHGFWSAFQSLGAMNARLDKPIQILGMLIATVLTLGFLGIPLWLYFDTAGGAM